MLKSEWLTSELDTDMVFPSLGTFSSQIASFSRYRKGMLRLVVSWCFSLPIHSFGLLSSQRIGAVQRSAKVT